MQKLALAFATMALPVAVYCVQENSVLEKHFSYGKVAIVPLNAARGVYEICFFNFEPNSTLELLAIPFDLYTEEYVAKHIKTHKVDSSGNFSAVMFTVAGSERKDCRSVLLFKAQGQESEKIVFPIGMPTNGNCP